ncbi:hypothetical protein [Cytobacillus praedii]|uniref:hypothetical protein n=1 Tax=Cytobacillus praedii TaxID=1742358 RepID=UPI000708C305|nr:hypothetical protein [Cytobacillus praedii]
MFWNKKPKETAEACVWFSYTVMLPENDEDDNEVTVIGNMIIKNTGTSVLNTPMICIRIKPPEDVRLGGKIGSVTHTALMIDGTNSESWHYFHDNWKEQAEKTGEHWLKPNRHLKLEPGEKLSFENELRIPTTKREKFVLIEGFFYSEEIKNGIRTLNNISINL